MTIGIANDHRGLNLKQELTKYLKDLGYNIIDYGTNTIEPTDYPIYAFKVGEAVKNQNIDFGILICGTGIGMSIAANKIDKVRCAKVDNIDEAILSRKHNNANVIAISENNINAKEIVKTFITTDFSNEERHLRRVELIDNYD